MRVNEIFESIQGEGLYMGAPMTFVRFSGCALCCGKCDTSYAWPAVGDYYTPQSLYLKVGGLQANRVCLTGGEPLFQIQSEVGDLIEKLAGADLEVHIETSGHYRIAHQKIVEHTRFWSISPKMTCMEPTSAPDADMLRDTLMYIADGGFDQGQLKFVIRDVTDVMEVRELLLAIHEEPCDLGWPVVLQPLSQHSRLDGTGYFDAATYNSHLKDIVRYAKEVLEEWDTRVMPQLHLMLWEGKRGV